MGGVWKCLVKRKIFAITTGGPIQVQVVELFDIDRGEQSGNNREDDIYIKPQVADDMGTYDLQKRPIGRTPPGISMYD